MTLEIQNSFKAKIQNSSTIETQNSSTLEIQSSSKTKIQNSSTFEIQKGNFLTLVIQTAHAATGPDCLSICFCKNYERNIYITIVNRMLKILLLPYVFLTRMFS